MLLVLLSLSLTACSKSGNYLKNQKSLLAGKVLQVDPNGPMAGSVRRYNNVQQAELARATNQLFDYLKQTGEIVSFHQYTAGNFKEAAGILKILNENNIDIYVKGEDIVFGIQPGNDICIRSGDMDRAKSYLAPK